ncbi:MAG TPA: TIGR02453 family protein [Saprospirales bacterium]|nr:TIGR02453 family protein [Saprospirales bacterium]HAY70602.1 TIGR02453 family protein [Saprospirales bacterium]HRQ28421.1 DUF2461 domain-containing protein [Saprospiraceae bacterium]
MATFNLNDTFNFLVDLRFNNTREWFKDNESRYKQAKAQFDLFIDELIPAIKMMDPSIDVESAKECTFRIFRDVRFSKNKEPYKTNMGAFVAKGGRKSRFGGYYIHFEPDASFLGGGIYMPEPSVLSSIRQGIYNNAQPLISVLHDQEFIETYGSLMDEKLKTPPKGFDKSYEHIDLLKYKHYAVGHNVDNSFWFKENIVELTMEKFGPLYQLNTIVNQYIA